MACSTHTFVDESSATRINRPTVSNHPLVFSLDGSYLDGVSLTFGLPRQHIWSFASAGGETAAINTICPCTRPADTFDSSLIPEYVGQDYFCDTGSRTQSSVIFFYAEDPLWDGEGCGGDSTCCQFNDPPWFCKALEESTTKDIEHLNLLHTISAWE